MYHVVQVLVIVVEIASFLGLFDCFLYGLTEILTLMVEWQTPSKGPRQKDLKKASKWPEAIRCGVVW